jgi:hypothetical protein
LCEDLHIIKTFKDVEEEALLKDINNNELKNLKIQKLINNNKENTNSNKNININKNDNNNDDDINSAEFSLS